MAFVFAYGLDGTLTTPIKDMPLETVTNYTNGGMKKGDLVTTTAAGLIKRVGAAGGAGIGVTEGGEFTGLAGAPYTATNASFTASSIDTTKNPNGVAKVRMDKAAVYKVPVAQSGAKQTANNADIGVSYSILLAAGTNDQTVDLNTTTTPSVKVVDYSKDGKFVFVTLV
jgi:hypothetical protein